jgi:LmbE family N-acetylglucosaminyl deacetylase
MENAGRAERDFRARCLQTVRTLGLVLLVGWGAGFGPTGAEAPAARPSPVDPLPQDTGAAGLQSMLLRLQNTARLMQTTAHPDDEDGGMLTLESRGHGVTALLMTLTRGEGGQNKIGSNLFDVLGVLRTLELTASDRYYAVEQRFSRVADFGYSKSPEETFQKWGGHDIPLGDMVRVIRTFRPDVLIARFSGTERDGHGHHQASAIVTQEAFRAAADPQRFPEQIQEGLLPWQAKKLYIGNVCGFGAMTCAAENYTVKLNTGAMNPVLGASYIQFAMDGLRHQLSQGAGGWSVEPGDRFTYYKLVDSVLPSARDQEGHEQDFFDGIDTSLPGLASRLGGEEKAAPFLRPRLEQIAGWLKQASAAAEKDSSAGVPSLSAALESISQLIERDWGPGISAGAQQDVRMRLREKQAQMQCALRLALNLSLEATVVAPESENPPGQPDRLPAISPGQKFAVSIRFHNGSKYPVQVHDLVVQGMIPAAVMADKETERISPGHDYEHRIELQLPANFPYTRPALRRNDPERDSVYSVNEPRFGTLPFPPFPFQVVARYRLAEIGSPSAPERARRTYATLPSTSAPVLAWFRDENGRPQKAPLAVTPAFSVMLEPGIQTIRTAGDPGCNVKVGVSYNLSAAVNGKLRLEVPSSWRVEPAERSVNFQASGEKQDFQFRVFPASLSPGRAEIRANLRAGGKDYSEGYSLVTREDLASFYYYQPAVQRVSMVDVKLPPDLRLAYIPGAGDEIPTVLEQLGIDLHLIPAERLAGEDLSRFGTIVLGIRAYDTQKDLVANHQKLLDYVAAGGTLIVQYNAGVGDFNSGHFTPFPARLSRARVSVEEAGVEILAAEDSVFHYPNQIAPRDFDGWVQERGLYFMDQWDSNFKPLLSSHDPGEAPLPGGLLRARYGKGTYIYTGYAFFRQLPAGVPGAIRLYVNLLAAGHER